MIYGKPQMAAHVLGKLGGVAQVARLLGHKHPSTVQGWRESGLIPSSRHAELLQCALAAGMDLAPADFVRHLAIEQIVPPAQDRQCRDSK